MFGHRIIQKGSLLGLAMGLVAQAAAAQPEVGQVTAINLERNKIVISGRELSLSGAAKLSLYGPLRNLRPGQGVRFVAEGGTVLSLEPVQLPPN